MSYHLDSLFIISPQQSRGFHIECSDKFIRPKHTKWFSPSANSEGYLWTSRGYALQKIVRTHVVAVTQVIICALKNLKRGRFGFV